MEPSGPDDEILGSTRAPSSGALHFDTGCSRIALPLLSCGRAPRVLKEAAPSRTRAARPNPIAAPAPTEAATETSDSCGGARAAYCGELLRTCSRSHEGISLGIGGRMKEESEVGNAGNDGSRSLSTPRPTHSQPDPAAAGSLAAALRSPAAAAAASSRELMCRLRAPKHPPSCPCVGPGRDIHQQEIRRVHSSDQSSPVRTAVPA